MRPCELDMRRSLAREDLRELAGSWNGEREEYAIDRLESFDGLQGAFRIRKSGIKLLPGEERRIVSTLDPEREEYAIDKLGSLDSLSIKGDFKRSGRKLFNGEERRIGRQLGSFRAIRTARTFIVK